MTPPKTFAVAVRAGRRMASYPFGRLTISADGTTVSSRFAPRIAPHSAPKETITEVTCYGWPAYIIEFTDEQGELADVTVNAPRFRRVLRELRTRGYPVTARRYPLTGRRRR